MVPVTRFVQWRRAGVWERITAALAAGHDPTVQMIDPSIVRVHQHRSHRDDPPSLAMRAMAGLESAEAPLCVGGSNPDYFRLLVSGLLRGACHRARIRATRWLAMTPKLLPATATDALNHPLLLQSLDLCFAVSEFRPQYFSCVLT